MNMQIKYELFRASFERALGEFCSKFRYRPHTLSESMQYSLLAGGKRIRPVLFYSVLDAAGYDFMAESDYAIAIECIHTYSLIHDDLPAMDNDDYRRGKPSNHKVFGEANAILAGDALLTLAFELLLGRSDETHLAAARVLAHAAGAHGMVAGQVADLSPEGEDLQFIHEHKTARLISAPLEMAAILTGRDREPFAAFGHALGLLFQVTDDLLDEGTEEGNTAVSVYGRSRAEALADRYAATCREAIGSLDVDTEFLRSVVELVRTRTA